MTINRRNMLAGSLMLPFFGFLPIKEIHRLDSSEAWEDRIAKCFVQAFVLGLDEGGYGLENLKMLWIQEAPALDAKTRVGICGYLGVMTYELQKGKGCVSIHIKEHLVHTIDWKTRVLASPQKVIDRCYQYVEELVNG